MLTKAFSSGNLPFIRATDTCRTIHKKEPVETNDEQLTCIYMYLNICFLSVCLDLINVTTAKYLMRDLYPTFCNTNFLIPMSLQADGVNL